MLIFKLPAVGKTKLCMNTALNLLMIQPLPAASD